MEKLSFIILVAILVEGVVDWIKDLSKADVRWPKVLALAVAFPLLYLLELDIFQLVGITPPIPVLGTLLLAVVVSRGAGYVHDFLGRISAWKKGEQAS